ncbi:type I restriction endonuclease subunit R [Chryseobacterium camelliae]|uniref:type I restriction endonuclease subunit R n=1 Tax=Chryseobacterium camelliae TaxID=1265445 RepID=UPI00285934DC|nr:type I restriction endonuclease subunit R [Chryseobacterium camelliae]MDR6515921.1 type I restriction enzyme R subunit [Chryseobacterium camelliae]
MASQPEYILEQRLIDQLQQLGHKKVMISNEADLIRNLKTQLEIHNKKAFSDQEFEKILNHLSKGNVFEKAKILRDKFHFVKDDGTSEWIEFISQDHWCQNQFQVTHQVAQEGNFKNRYDVTILINGLPLVQIELKRRGLEMKEAFNQIDRYRHQSFNSGYGLYNYVQIFVISNGENTKYYANSINTRQKVSESFEQTFYWSDEDNKNITKLDKFASIFLDPCHVAKIITKYIVLNQAHKILMVFRPYQYYAVEKIVDRVRNTNKNGFIWHTTGSGKTLTSFKASQILKEIPKVEKVVFVVDRKDLDYQTQIEFNAYEQGSVDTTNDTKNLVQKLSGSNKLIVTTLQKLNTAITKEKHGKKIEHLKDKKMVFIFDECHRSQFGETHQNIKKHFKKAQMIGFTGTPISEVNSVGLIDGKPATTNRLFEEPLHKYVITDAIGDGNVLKFSIEYVGRYKEKEKSNTYIDTDVEGIDTQELLNSSQRIEKITDYIISQYDRKTNNRTFNAMFCVSSIEVLKQYYDLFQKKKEEGKHNLKIATIFSYGSNISEKNASGNFKLEDEDDLAMVAESIPNYGNSHDRNILEKYIGDYNEMFGMTYTTKDSKSFYDYYNNISKRVKNRDIDLLLVVNMFLTGFDSKTLNTLFVDKNLKYHGLIQAFSRTNRILDNTKSQGNIICFRNLKFATDDAVTLFSNKEAIKEIIILPIEDYIELFNNALEKLKIIAPETENVSNYKTDQEKFEFITAFREVMRVLNVLKSFADFDFEKLKMNEDEFNGYKSKYLDLWTEIRGGIIGNREGKESILDDVDFELELIHRDEINVSYILSLLANLTDSNLTDKKRENKKKEIRDILSGDAKLRSKKELIEKFIDENLPHIADGDDVNEEFEKFWNREKVTAFDKIVDEESLNKDRLKDAIDDFLFSSKTPKISDTLKLLETKPKLTERNNIGRRIIQKVQDFVDVFIDGVSA